MVKAMDAPNTNYNTGYILILANNQFYGLLTLRVHGIFRVFSLLFSFMQTRYLFMPSRWILPVILVLLVLNISVLFSAPCSFLQKKNRANSTLFQSSFIAQCLIKPLNVAARYIHTVETSGSTPLVSHNAAASYISPAKADSRRNPTRLHNKTNPLSTRKANCTNI